MMKCITHFVKRFIDSGNQGFQIAVELILWVECQNVFTNICNLI